MATCNDCPVNKKAGIHSRRLPIPWFQSNLKTLIKETTRILRLRHGFESVVILSGLCIAMFSLAILIFHSSPIFNVTFFAGYFLILAGFIGGKLWPDKPPRKRQALHRKRKANDVEDDDDNDTNPEINNDINVERNKKSLKGIFQKEETMTTDKNIQHPINKYTIFVVHSDAEFDAIGFCFKFSMPTQEDLVEEVRKKWIEAMMLRANDKKETISIELLFRSLRHSFSHLGSFFMRLINKIMVSKNMDVWLTDKMDKEMYENPTDVESEQSLLSKHFIFSLQPSPHQITQFKLIDRDRVSSSELALHPLNHTVKSSDIKMPNPGFLCFNLN